MAVVDRKRIAPLWVEWDIIDVLVKGKSAIDMPDIHCVSLPQAEQFLRSYGYDLGKEKEAREIQTVFQQAKDLVRDLFAEDPEHKSPPLVMPREIAEETDVRKILVMASVRTGSMQRWACAMLRLMHTITHVTNDFSRFFFPQIQRQVVQKLENFVYQDPEDGGLFLGQDNQGIPLYQLEIKSSKPFESSILKLLHKVENIGASIFDRIGVRIVTQTRLDALLALKFMVDHYMISYPNVNPVRSRNTLAEADYIRRELDKLLPLYNRGEISRDELKHLAHMIAESEAAKPRVQPEALKARNAFSSTAYSSIQFTVRQLIRVTMPGVTDPATGRHIESGQAFRFFFPYEVQLLDRQAYLDSRKGRASHEEYKRNQLIVARHRIFGNLLNAPSEGSPLP